MSQALETYLQESFSLDTSNLSQMNLGDFCDPEIRLSSSKEARMIATLYSLLELSQASESTVIDPLVVDSMIAALDKRISAFLDKVLHDPEFQRLESLWRGLAYMIDRTDFRANIKCELLDVDKSTLAQDFEQQPSLTESGLFKQLYTQEYDMPGGEPVSAMISSESFVAGQADVGLLKSIAEVASMTHCPFISSVGADFFGKDNMEEVLTNPDLVTHLSRSDYIPWQSLRESEQARYLGFVLPKFLLRLPYGTDNPVRSFHYEEVVRPSPLSDFLWGNASFAFAVNLTRSFRDNGWLVNIRGPETGGKVSDLPLHFFNSQRGPVAMMPTECVIPESKELALSELGFIPLSFYKNTNYACFFSANSLQKPKEYTDDAATANSRINARLPYVFLSARLGHYLKVLQRENIGAAKSAKDLEEELNTWLKTLVTKMNNPDPNLAATHPLREAYVTVEPYADDPGFYRVKLFATPHFQIEGIDVSLSLVSAMPAATN